MARPVHEIGRVLAVMDGELRIEPDALRIFAQQARADGVEGARPGGDGGRGGFGRKTARDDPLDAPVELGCGSAREGREHDALGIGAGKDQRRDPVREHRRLPRARAGDDKERRRATELTEPVLDRPLLLRVELDGCVGANQCEGHGSR